VRLAVRKLLTDERYARRAGEIRAWSAEHDGPQTAADAVEAFASDEQSRSE